MPNGQQQRRRWGRRNGATGNEVDDNGNGATWRRRRGSYEISGRPRENFR
jgi:hypothetical protein